MKNIGIKVLFDTIVTETKRRVMTDAGVYLADGGELLTKQKVLAVGPNVKDVKVGDFIEIDTKRFPRVEEKAKHDIGPNTYHVIPPVEQIGDKQYLFLDSRAVKWIYDDNDVKEEKYEVSSIKPINQ